MKKLLFDLLTALKVASSQCKPVTEWPIKSVAFVLRIWEALGSVLSLEVDCRLEFF